MYAYSATIFNKLAMIWKIHCCLFDSKTPLLPGRSSKIFTSISNTMGLVFSSWLFVLFLFPRIAIARDQRPPAPHRIETEIVVSFVNDTEPFRRVPVRNEGSVDRLLVQYQARSDIRYAEPIYEVEAFSIEEPLYGKQWNLHEPEKGGIHLKKAWQYTKGKGTTVAILDSGIAYENLSPYVQAPELERACVKPGYDFLQYDSGAHDDNGHGTHIATVIAAAEDGQGIVGIAPETCILPYKVLDSRGRGTTIAVAEAIRSAVRNNASVINMSFGAYIDVEVIREAIEYAHRSGVSLVAASGNSGIGFVAYPAAYEHVIAVGASRVDSTRVMYSNYGSQLDLLAPGGDLYLDQNNDNTPDGILGQTFRTDPSAFEYYGYHGTSFATPHVAAAVALLRAYDPSLTPEAVQTQLFTHARDQYELGWDAYSGWGVLDLTTLFADEMFPLPSPTLTPTPTPTPYPTASPTATPEPTNAPDTSSQRNSRNSRHAERTDRR
jgi:serine protease